MSKTGYPSLRERYSQLFVLILAGGAIYPVLYLRQNFEVSLLETYQLTQTQLGEAYSLLGVMFVLGYLPSGWLADRFPPRWLLAGSMVATALLAFWFAQIPNNGTVKWIFLGWGLSTGLTFWGSMIKACSIIAPHDRQGSFFGLLEGGRGAIEALLATLAVALFAALLNQDGSNTKSALSAVVYLYAGASLLIAPVVLLLLKLPSDVPPTAERSMATVAPSVALEEGFDASNLASSSDTNGLIRNLRVLLGNPRIWLAGFVILTGYQLFWATYSFSGLLQTVFGLSAVAAGTLTVAKLWMRPLGAVLAGVMGDRFDAVLTLSRLMLLSAFGLLVLPLLPATLGVIALLGVVLSIGLVTYGIRGIYWATLEDCNVPNAYKGLAIGLISLLGYAPDIYLPLLKAALLDRWPDAMGYLVYYGILSSCGVLGAWAAYRLARER